MIPPKRKKVEKGKNGDDVEAVIDKIFVEDCALDITALLKLRDHLQNSKDNVSIFFTVMNFWYY